MNQQLWNSIQTGLIDNNIVSFEEQRPALLLNNENSKVINYIRKELEKCTEFYFSVAFITEGGLSLLLHTLNTLDKKGIKGKLITADYLRFNNPKIFERLLKIPNLEVRINNTSNFHAKGYIFKHLEDYSIIVGSSNLTMEALTKNQEWNLRISSMQNGQLIIDSLEEFDRAWEEGIQLNQAWIEDYKDIYYRTVRIDIHEEELKSKTIKPNKMQMAALHNLEQLRNNGSNKGLLISATGTGKTYLSVFDVQQYKPKKVLFVAHRERLLKSSERSFKRILGKNIKTGFYTSLEKMKNADYLFASISTISRDIHLSQFSSDEFDYIIIDEVHRAGAESYQKILNYFKPKFLLGMTATPERTDDYNIYKLFDYKIAFEIRLQNALEEDMLCPFHYFGITEIEVDGEVLSELSDFKYLVSDIRADYVIEKAKYYGYSGKRVKGLIFCSRNEEAAELSRKFNERGLRTIALSGSDSDVERENAILRLEQDEEEGALDYIFTVDIFNEGIDIPAVNQVVMLRKTKSSIVFIQQLGRGLRKYIDKNYVVILDFIGNYDNNFLIPISLSGDQTYNKDNIRKFMNNANTIIPGCSSIEFDQVVKEKIFKTINTAKFNEEAFLKAEYLKLKNKLGRVPNHVDFIEYEAIDLQNIIKKHKSYINFLLKREPEFKITFSKEQLSILEFLSREVSNGKRNEEIEILSYILENGKINKPILQEFQNSFSFASINSAILLLSGGFLRGQEWKMYNNCYLLECDKDNIYLSDKFKETLKQKEFKNIIVDLLEYSKKKFNNDYSKKYSDTNFNLYEKYTRKDVCRLLNWDTNHVPLNIGGYKYDEKTKTIAVFITYEKAEDIAESIKYEDRFVNRKFMICVSKNNRTLNSPEILRIYDKVNKSDIHLFVNRLKEEEEFYYMGCVESHGEPKQKIRDNGDSVVEITYELDQQVREDVYNFITA